MTFVEQPSVVDPVRTGFIADINAARAALGQDLVSDEGSPLLREKLSTLGNQLLELPVNFGPDAHNIMKSLLRPELPANKIADSLSTALDSLRIAVRFDNNFNDAALELAVELVRELRKILDAERVEREIASLSLPGERLLFTESAISEQREGIQKPIRNSDLIQRLSAPLAEEPETLELLILLAQQRLHEGNRILPPAQQRQIETALHRAADEPKLSAGPRQLARNVLNQGW